MRVLTRYRLIGNSLDPSLPPLPEFTGNQRNGFYKRKIHRTDTTPDFRALLCSVLTERQRKVFCLRHALDEDRSYSMAEIGLYIGFSGGRATQIYHDAWAKLVRPEHRRALLDALDPDPDARLIREPQAKLDSGVPGWGVRRTAQK